MQTMMTRVVGYAALATALAAPLAYATGGLELVACKWVMLLATFVWFAVSAVELVIQNTQAKNGSSS